MHCACLLLQVFNADLAWPGLLGHRKSAQTHRVMPVAKNKLKVSGIPVFDESAAAWGV